MGIMNDTKLNTLTLLQTIALIVVVSSINTIIIWSVLP